MSRHDAVKLIEAAEAGLAPAEAPGELAVLLEAVEILKAAAPAPEPPDAEFASALKADLVARYDDLPAVEGPEAGASPGASGRRWLTFALPAAAAAAALVITLVLVVLRPAGQPVVATLEVDAGRAYVTTSDGKRTTVRGQRELRLSEEVVVGGGSRATVDFKNRNVARLEAGTEVRVEGYGDNAVSVLVNGGKIYNRVVRGTSYTVEHEGVTVSATGTAFDVEPVGRGLNAVVYEGSVQVTLPKRRPVKVNSGYQAIVTYADGSFHIKVVRYRLSTLDFSWLAFNRDLDKIAGLDLGALNALSPTPPQGVEPPQTPAPTDPAPTGPAPSTTPEPAPQTEPAPPGEPSAQLQVSQAGPPVSLQWSGTNVQAADAVVIVRDPGGAIATFGAKEAYSFDDASVQPGSTYSYRVQYMSAGRLLVESNPASVTVPIPEPPPIDVNLGGYQTTDGMQLKWSGSRPPDEWVVLRTRQGEPTYPGSAIATLGGGSSGGSFFDKEATPNIQFFYRIAALSSGKVYYSNTISNF